MSADRQSPITAIRAAAEQLSGEVTGGARARIRAALETAAQALEQAATSQDAVQTLTADLRARGFPVTFDGHVDAAGAAAALGIKPKTLRNQRSLGDGPRYVTRRGRPWYPVAALATWISVSGRQLTASAGPGQCIR